MKKKNLKNLVLRKQSVSNLNKTYGGNASDVGSIIDTIIDFTQNYRKKGCVNLMVWSQWSGKDRK